MSLEAELIAINQRSVSVEQSGGPGAQTFFEDLLSEHLIFHRATGKVVGKRGPEGFLEGLAKNPFKGRVVESIEVNLLADRALVDLVVVGTRKDDGSDHRYRNIRLFSRIGDKWILEFWYNYEVT